MKNTDPNALIATLIVFSLCSLLISTAISQSATSQSLHSWGELFYGLFKDDFTGDLSNWAILNGTWNIEGDVLNGVAEKEGLIYGGQPDWLNYHLRTRVRISSDSVNNEVAFIVRYEDEYNYYWLGLGCWRHKASISRMVNRTIQELVYVGNVSEVTTDKWYDLEIVANGNLLQLYVDGVLELETEDSTHYTGAIGIRPYNSHVQVDYVQVDYVNATPPPSSPQLRVNGLYLEDGLGHRVNLKSIQVDWNERVKKYGSIDVANSPEESWFTLDDIKRIKDAGGNCIEIHQIQLPNVMPTRNMPNENYFRTWIDKWVSWVTQYQLYCIIDIKAFDGRYDYSRKSSIPKWLWQNLGYETPTTKETANIIIRDFFNLSVAKQDINREAFKNAWKFIANRYKDNPYVIFSLNNEPYCGVDLQGEDASFGQYYSTLMEQTVDAIRSVGAYQLVFINKPYVWPMSNVKPVNRVNIVWEDHLYVTSSSNIDSWKSYLDTYVQRFVIDFGKPLFVGEHGFHPMSVIRIYYSANWQTILADQVAYLNSNPVVGRQWHNWGYIDGEVYDYSGDSDLSPEESNWIIQTVLG